MKRKHKYNAKPTIVDGIRFASKKEANRYQELKILLKAKVIQDLVLQPRFPCHVKDKLICTYVADFKYIENGQMIIEDVKGMKTPIYRLKKKLVEALYYIKITEV